MTFQSTNLSGLKCTQHRVSGFALLTIWCKVNRALLDLQLATNNRRFKAQVKACRWRHISRTQIPYGIISPSKFCLLTPLWSALSIITDSQSQAQQLNCNFKSHLVSHWRWRTHDNVIIVVVPFNLLFHLIAAVTIIRFSYVV